MRPKSFRPVDLHIVPVRSSVPVALAIVAFAPALHAADYTINGPDGGDCVLLGGDWDGYSPMSPGLSCSLADLQLGVSDELTLVDVGLYIDGTLSNSGTIRADRSSLLVPSNHLGGMSGGVLENLSTGTIVLEGGGAVLAIDTAARFENAGKVIVESGSTISNSGYAPPPISSGVIVNTDTGTIANDGDIENQGWATIQNYGVIDNDGSLDNLGSLVNFCSGVVSGNAVTSSQPDSAVTLGFGADKESLSWCATTDASSYEAARSSSSQFSADCGLHATTSTEWIDFEVPAPGSSFFYLARPAAPIGSWGIESSGNGRIVSCSWTL